VLDGQKFDYIVCVEILEHIFYPDRALTKLKRVLADDGRLIVSFPNIAWWKYRLKLLSGHFPEESRLYHHAEHLHDFTLHTFTELMESASLIVEEMAGEFIPPEFLNRWIPKKFLTRHMRAHPNIYGYQVVFRTRIG
jgi:2-polyprenyl-3-methyl-5-hydroxy-6-metoxy-1,4-benzoquinol methylase